VTVEGVATDEGVVETLGGVGGEVTVCAGERGCWEGRRSGGGSGGWPADKGTGSTG